MKVNVGVSKKHVHLKEETFKKIFGDIELEVRNPLNQVGQFASTSTVDINTNGITIERLRIVGPFRNIDQIELSQSDADILGVNPPRNISGDLTNTLPITIIGPLGEITLDNGLMLVKRHIHIPTDIANELGYQDEDIVEVYKDNNKLMDVQARVEENAALEIHIDTDEEEEFNLHTGDEVEIKACGK